MGATGFKTGNDKRGFWYKYFDSEILLYLTDETINEDLDNQAISNVLLKQYDNSYAKNISDKRNHALMNAMIEVLSKHGEELYDQYIEELED